jgi:hypothetical protein
MKKNNLSNIIYKPKIIDYVTYKYDNEEYIDSKRNEIGWKDEYFYTNSIKDNKYLKVENFNVNNIKYTRNKKLI